MGAARGRGRGSGTPLLPLGQGSGGLRRAAAGSGLLRGLLSSRPQPTFSRAAATRGAHPRCLWVSRGFLDEGRRRGSGRGLSCCRFVCYVQAGQSRRGPSLASRPVPLVLLWRKRREGFGAGSAPAGTLGAPAGRQGWPAGGSFGSCERLGHSLGFLVLAARTESFRAQRVGAWGPRLELPGPGQPLPHAAASEGSAPPRVPALRRPRARRGEVAGGTGASAAGGLRGGDEEGSRSRQGWCSAEGKPPINRC